MSIAEWPTLSRTAEIDDFQEYPITDTTIRQRDADGRPLNRTGTAPLLYRREFDIRHMTNADRLLLKTFQDTTVRIGGEPFTFLDPRFDDSGYIYTVRLAQPLEFGTDGAKDEFRTHVVIDEEPGY